MCTADKVLSAKLRNLSDDISVVVVHGSAALPVFEKVFLSAIQDAPLLIELQATASTVLARTPLPSADDDGKKKRKRDVAVIGADNSGDPIQMIQYSQPAAKCSTVPPEAKSTAASARGHGWQSSG